MTDLELAREWLRGISDDAEDAVALAAIMTRIRLDEAKWWRGRTDRTDGIHPSGCGCERCEHIVSLEQAAGGEK